ncbi:hypothetical protein [Delftia lacustris]|jgi:hypothetical protein|uniref:hypothetical protein n=1 Tax=Delftia lacustris TaxID=558537 RepID=UPI000ABD4C94|nr:hypothetical protein [Delftia lacustris]
MATPAKAKPAADVAGAQDKKIPNRRLIDAEIQRVMEAGPVHGVERDVVDLFRESVAAKVFEDRIPMTEHDTVVYEMALKFGRADIVVFHVDGSVSVIEVKDGTKGYNHVVAGIGQAALYACQIAMSKATLKRVRRCLLWTSVGDIQADGAIEQACEDAGVIPLPWQSMKSLMATTEAMRNLFANGSFDRQE